VVKEVFVDPQPPLRLPYNWYVRSRPAAAGVAKEEAAKRRHAKVAATRIRRRRVDIENLFNRERIQRDSRRSGIGD